MRIELIASPTVIAIEHDVVTELTEAQKAFKATQSATRIKEIVVGKQELAEQEGRPFYLPLIMCSVDSAASSDPSLLKAYSISLIQLDLRRNRIVIKYKDQETRQYAELPPKCLTELLKIAALPTNSSRIRADLLDVVNRFVFPKISTSKMVPDSKMDEAIKDDSPEAFSVIKRSQARLSIETWKKILAMKMEECGGKSTALGKEIQAASSHLDREEADARGIIREFKFRLESRPRINDQEKTALHQAVVSDIRKIREEIALESMLKKLEQLFDIEEAKARYFSESSVTLTGKLRRGHFSTLPQG
jgi:hypothetical protein